MVARRRAISLAPGLVRRAAARGGLARKRELVPGRGGRIASPTAMIDVLSEKVDSPRGRPRTAGAQPASPVWKTRVVAVSTTSRQGQRLFAVAWWFRTGRRDTSERSRSHRRDAIKAMLNLAVASPGRRARTGRRARRRLGGISASKTSLERYSRSRRLSHAHSRGRGRPGTLARSRIAKGRESSRSCCRALLAHAGPLDVASPPASRRRRCRVAVEYSSSLSEAYISSRRVVAVQRQISPTALGNGRLVGVAGSACAEVDRAVGDD